MLKISVIVEIRELGPHGPGRAAVGIAQKNVPNLAPQKSWSSLFFDALRRAMGKRSEHLQEIARLARQSDLFPHKLEPF